MNPRGEGHSDPKRCGSSRVPQSGALGAPASMRRSHERGQNLQPSAAKHHPLREAQVSLLPIHSTAFARSPGLVACTPPKAITPPSSPTNAAASPFPARAYARWSAPARYGPAKQAQHTKDQRHVDRHQEAVQNLVRIEMRGRHVADECTQRWHHHSDQRHSEGMQRFQDHINDPLRLIDVARIECLPLFRGGRERLRAR